MIFRTRINGRVGPATVTNGEVAEQLGTFAFEHTVSLPFSPQINTELVFHGDDQADQFRVTIKTVAWWVRAKFFSCELVPLTLADFDECPSLGLLAAWMRLQGFTVTLDEVPALASAPTEPAARPGLGQKEQPLSQTAAQCSQLLKTGPFELSGSRGCRYCSEESSYEACPACEDTYGACFTCHAEIVHGVIKNQNIHIAGTLRAAPRDDVSPWQANAIRCLEDG
jgi:hypothetical protein